MSYDGVAMKVFNGTEDKTVYVSLKIDGVRAIRKNGTWTSRANKPLYNLPETYPDGEYEVYLGNFKDSISAVKTHNGAQIKPHNIYRLLPNVEPTLVLGFMSPDNLPMIFKAVRAKGYEGLVVKDSKGLFKIKDMITLDVEVVGKTKGTGQYTGLVGALIVRTEEGVEFKVGSGLTKQNRLDFSINEFPMGKLIEVEGMELLPSGKLRHPRFVRIREDLR